MNRRQFVAVSSAGTILGVSGCISNAPAGPNSDTNGGGTDKDDSENESEDAPPEVKLSDDTPIVEFEMSGFDPDLSEGDWKYLEHVERVALLITSEEGGETVMEIAKEGWESPSDEELGTLKEFLKGTDFSTSVLVYALTIGNDHGYRLDPVTIDVVNDEIELTVMRWRKDGMEPQEPIPIATLVRIQFNEEPLIKANVSFQNTGGDTVEEVETIKIEEWERAEEF